MAARINRLIDLSEKEQNEDTAKGFELQARELSIKHRIQSPFTSFLVLETEADYQRFQITRNSLTNILTIGVGGLEVINRRNSKNYEFLSEERIEEARRNKEASQTNHQGKNLFRTVENYKYLNLHLEVIAAKENFFSALQND
jgi:hypothetical protein